MDNLSFYGVFLQIDSRNRTYCAVFELQKRYNGNLIWGYVHYLGIETIREPSISSIKFAMNKSGAPFIRVTNQFCTIDYIDGDLKNATYSLDEVEERVGL